MHRSKFGVQKQKVDIPIPEDRRMMSREIMVWLGIGHDAMQDIKTLG
jgi:hypothetical protein